MFYNLERMARLPCVFSKVSSSSSCRLDWMPNYILNSNFETFVHDNVF